MNSADEAVLDDLIGKRLKEWHYVEQEGVHFTLDNGTEVICFGLAVMIPRETTLQ